MAAIITLKSNERCALGEIDTYTLTWKVTDAQEIDANIFVVEYTRTNPHLNKFDSEFHHVAYLPEMDSIRTTLDTSTHQYIRQSSITRTYPTIERLEESKKVMLNDIKNLLRTYNELVSGSRESEIVVTDKGYVCTKTDDIIYTFNGEEITIE